MSSMKEKRLFLQYSCLFTCVVIIFIVIMLSQNKGFIASADAYNCYYPTYVYVGDYIRKIPENLIKNGYLPLYSFDIGFGGNIIEELNWTGFGDVFNLTAVFFPGDFSEVGYACSIFLRMYVAGIGFLVWGKRRVHSDSALLASAITYAFSGYIYYYGLGFPTMLTGISVIPFIAYGIDFIIANNKKYIVKSIVFGIAVQGLCGFIFVFIDVVFFILYFVLSYFWAKGFNIKEFLHKALQIIVNGLIGLCLVAPFFVGQLNGYLLSGRVGDINIDWGIFKLWYSNFSETFISRINSLISVNDTGCNGLFLGFLCVIGIVSCYLSKKQLDIKILFMIYSILYFNIGFGSMMNGFAYSSDRWTYIMSFVCAMVMSVGLEHINEKSILLSIISFCIALALTKYAHESIQNSDEILQVRNYINMFLYFLVIIIALMSKYGIFFKFLPFASCLCVLANMIFCFMPKSFFGNDYANKLYANNGVYREITSSKFLEYSSLEEGFRTDIIDTSLCASLMTRTKGTASYYSAQTPELYNVLNYYGVSSAIFGGSSHIRGLDGRMGLESVFAVRYYQENHNEPNIYENPAYLPVIYTYDKYYLIGDAPKDLLDRNDMLLKAACVDTSPKVDVDMYTEDVSSRDLSIDIMYPEQIRVDDGGFNFTGKEKIIVEIKDDTDKSDEVYLQFESIKSTSAIAYIDIDGKSLRFTPYNESSTDGIFLVKLSNNQDIVNIIPEAGYYKFGEIKVSSIDVSEYEKFAKERTNNQIGNINVTDSTISCNITLDHDCIVCFSALFDDNMQVVANGENKKLVRVNNGLSGVELEEGKYYIELKYVSCLYRNLFIIMILAWSIVIKKLLL